MNAQRPAAEGLAPGHFPGPAVTAGHVVANPRRVRARDGDEWVLDSTTTYYVWEHPYYPQYAVPAASLPDRLRRGARALPAGVDLPGHVVLRFGAAQEWYEEEERVHGHPRSPYVRVDALRSRRLVTVTLQSEEGPRVLARTSSPVAVFETGLPPRWYVDPTAVDWSLLTPSSTVTRCPYKGEATSWWSAGPRTDVAWSYPAPTQALQPIAGLVAFDDQQVDVATDIATDIATDVATGTLPELS